MKFDLVVVGSEGRVGKELIRFFTPLIRVKGINHSEMDLLNIDQIRDKLESLDYRYILLSAALTDVDFCENNPELAYRVNRDAAEVISFISRKKNAIVIYLSTDMVFEGLQGSPYHETHPTDPVNVYGCSKLSGEQAVISNSAANLILRVSWLYGPSRSSFPNWVIHQSCIRSSIAIPDDKVACPTYVPDLVSWVNTLCFQRSGIPLAGVYHLCNQGACSWREWAQACIDIAKTVDIPVRVERVDSCALDSVGELQARRPKNSALCTDKFTCHCGVVPRGWRLALEDFVIQNRDTLLEEALGPSR